MRSILKACKNSIDGFTFAARTERAVRTELLLFGITVPAALMVTQRVWVAVALIAATAATISIELLNTAIEKLCDHINPGHHIAIGRVKDMGSAAVFCMLVATALLWGAAILERLGAFS